LVGLVTVFSAVNGDAQQPVDSTAIARLTALGRLWGVVKYFHPAFLDHDVAWDSATIIAIDEIRRAKSTADYHAAVASMLAKLGDPATRVIQKAPTASGPTTRRVAGRRWEADGADSTLVVSLPDPEDWVVARQTITDATADIKLAKSIVFDLRGKEPAELGSFSWMFQDISGYLPVTSVQAPSQRRRMYSGFVPQEGISSGGYWSGTYELAGDVFAVVKPNPLRHTVFLVYPGSDIPPVAFALRKSGQGAIVVDGAARDLAAGAATWSVDLGEDLRAVVRLSQMEGSTAADTAVTGGSEAAMKVALRLARATPVPPPVSNTMRAAYVPRGEESYASLRYPPVALRILAAYRFWNTIHYFYPYKHLIAEDWQRVLPHSIELLQSARDSLEYAKAVAEMVTHIHDSHGWVSGSDALYNFVAGRLYAAVQLQYIEGKPVVVSVADEPRTRASGIAPGDVVLAVDGEPVSSIRARVTPYRAHSTPQGLDAIIAWRLTKGADSMAHLKVLDRDDRVREISLPRRAEFEKLTEYPRSGPIMKMLPGNIGYADLSLLPIAMVDSMFELFRNTRGIIFDDRGYPQGTAWSIAPRLTDREKFAAMFQRPVVMSPDSSESTTIKFFQSTGMPSKWRYRGKTVLLVDERTMSQAEHTGLFLEAANGTTIIGSPTVGANGDVTSVVLPGGLAAWFSGHDVRHADGRQLQRVGLQPDIVVRPTLAGVRAGRDEVLERAVNFLRK
jgi:hypothetical protein